MMSLCILLSLHLPLPQLLFLIWLISLARMLHIWSASVWIDQKLATSLWWSVRYFTSGREWKMWERHCSLWTIYTAYITWQLLYKDAFLTEKHVWESAEMILPIKNTLLEYNFFFFVSSSCYNLMEARNSIPLTCWKSHPQLFESNQVCVLTCSGLIDCLTCI